MSNLPPNLSLNALKSFSAAADSLSIAGAAKTLHVTQGAISRQVKHVEEALDLPLFIRRNRAIFLTNEGALLHQTCKEMFSLLGSTIERFDKTLGNKPLVVSCEPTLAIRWLIPRLPLFKQAHPDIDIHLFTAGGPINLQNDNVDLALRRNDFTWNKTYFSEFIVEEKIGPVCTKSLWDETNKIFSNLCQLHTQTRRDAWSDWKNNAEVSLSAKTDMYFEHFYLSLQAALSGLGVAISSIHMSKDDIDAHRLIAPFGFITDGSEYHLISEQPLDKDSRKQAFRDWLIDELYDNFRYKQPSP